VPVYEYQCDDCGLRFERFHKSIPSDEEPVACEACGEPARKLVSASAHSFKHSENQTRGPLPPNTGTSDDWNYDKAIGRDAAQKWDAIKGRNAEKDRVIRQEAEQGRGITRDHLVPTGDADGNPYRVMTEPERVGINTRRAQAEKARELLRTPPGE